LPLLRPPAVPAALLRGLALVAVALALLAPATATAIAPDREAPLSAERHALTHVRAEVAAARHAVASGDRRGADAHARVALARFADAERALELRDPDLAHDAELALTDVRHHLRGGTGATPAALDAMLDRVDAALDPDALASPTLAFGLSFSVLLREGIEAVLLLAILLSALAAGQGGTSHRRPLGLGALAAVVATGVTWLLTTLVLDLAPVGRDLLEAIMGLTAVAVLSGVTLWLIGRLHQRRWLEFMRARTTAAVTAGSAGALGALAFAAVYREGFETVLLYQALVLLAPGHVLAIVLGGLVAGLALGALGYAILGLGRCLPLKVMIIGGAASLALLSVAFVGNAVRCLQEADLLAADPIRDGWARLPVLLAELTGLHPTVQGVTAQVALLAVYGTSALWLVRRGALRRRVALGQVAG
jgi:high-affinity iron transporter